MTPPRAFLGQAQQQSGLAQLPGAAQVEAVVGAVDVDHATAMARAGLRRHGNGQELQHRTRAGVRHHLRFLQQAGGVEAVAPLHTRLVLPDGLAGVEVQRLHGGLGRVGGELFRRQAQRVVGLLAVAAGQHHHRVVQPLPAQPQVGQLPVGRALWPKAAHVHGHGAGLEVEAAGQRRGHGGADLSQPEAARIGRQLDARLARRRTEQGDHPARTAAVEHGKRPPQHLHARRAGQVEVRHLSLPVGHGGGDAVGVQADAAHAEAGAGAEAARADLQVLRVIAAVGDDQPGHPCQALRQVDHRPGLAQRLAVDAGDRKRRLQRALGTQRARDDDVWLGRQGRIDLRKCCAGRQQQGEGC